jgi:hypothetical protein
MKFRTRGFVSLLLALTFLVASFSGVILYLTPRGRVANWTGWTMLGLDKHEWGAIHINACLLVLVLAIIHLILNWGIFWRYIRNKAAGLNLKLEMAVAVLVTAVLVIGTLTQVPPFSATLALNDQIKNYWEQGAATGPAPHAEEFTLERFASSVGLTFDDVAEALKKEGIEVEDRTATVGAVAEKNGLVPSQILSAVTKHFPEAANAVPAGRGMGRGMGRLAGGQGRGGDAMTTEMHDAADEIGLVAGDGQESHGFGMGPGGGRGMGKSGHPR